MKAPKTHFIDNAFNLYIDTGKTVLCGKPWSRADQNKNNVTCKACLKLLGVKQYMGTPKWIGPIEYCKECGTQKHPDRKCTSNKCLGKKK